MPAPVCSRRILRPIACALGALILCGALPLAERAGAQPPQASRAAAPSPALLPAAFLQLAQGRDAAHRSWSSGRGAKWKHRHGHHRHAKRRFHRRHTRHHAWGPHVRRPHAWGPHAWGPHAYGRRACHPVRHLGHHRGHRALLGAVVCYNRRGDAYILRGSRHVIRYLYR